jgi:hypothetical protein
MSIHHFKGKHKMFKTIAKLFKSSSTSGLEKYITSKNPQTNADVEQLTREYEAQPEIWARGL